MSQRLQTIIVLLRDRVACATFGARGTIRKFVALERTDVDEPNVAIVAALGALGEAIGETAVLSSDCAMHAIELPASSVLGLTPEALEQAVAFEVEPLSGLNAGESAVALRPLPSTPGRSRYWATMASYGFRDTIESAVSAFGGRVALLAHPGGLPQLLSSDAPRGVDWRRVEFWRGQTIRLATSGKTLTIRTDEEGVTLGDSSATIQAWRKLHPVAATEEVLHEVRDDAFGGEHGELALDDEATLRSWLAAWHVELSSRTPRVPVQIFARPPLTSRQRTVIALTLAAATFALCYVHNWWVVQNITSARAEQARLEAPGKDLAALKQKQTEIATAMSKDRAAEQTLKTDVANYQQALVNQRQRLHNLLQRLADETSPQWTLREIETSGQEFKIHGVTLDPRAIGTLAEEIGTQIRSFGWSIEPPKQTTVKRFGAPPHWEFELTLREVSGAPRSTVERAPPRDQPGTNITAQVETSQEGANE